MHDPRVGRFFAVDPLAPKYPFYSPYQFSGNRVIDMVELEGLEPDRPGTAEGQKESAFENPDEYFEEHPLNAVGWLLTHQEWTWHEGTKTSSKGWYSEDKYTQVIAPFAIDYAMLDGWRIGLDWQSAKNLVGNSPGSGHSISDSTMEFMNRDWDGNAYANFSKVGAKLINDMNKNNYMSATGLTESMEFSSPFFGAGMGLKGLATGETALTFSELPSTGFINPFNVRFSQESISGTFKNGNSVLDITQISESIPAIRIVEKDGLIYTLDNRRLRLFQEANLPVKFEKLNSIPESEMFKFTTKNQGQTIRIRGNSLRR